MRMMLAGVIAALAIGPGLASASAGAPSARCTPPSGADVTNAGCHTSVSAGSRSATAACGNATPSWFASVTGCTVAASSDRNSAGAACGKAFEGDADFAYNTSGCTASAAHGGTSMGATCGDASIDGGFATPADFTGCSGATSDPSHMTTVRCGRDQYVDYRPPGYYPTQGDATGCQVARRDDRSGSYTACSVAATNVIERQPEVSHGCKPGP